MTPEQRRAMRNPEKDRLVWRAKYLRNRETYLARRKAYAQTERGRETTYAGVRAWTLRNPEKCKAQSELKYAVRTGRITKDPCEVCGATDLVHGHHEDYSRPLEVLWLCPTHHAELHRLRRWEAA
jgi:hypothetical protein